MTLANTLSLTRLATVPLFLAAYHIPGRAGKLICLLILIFGVVTDLLDGHLARARQEVTRLGKLLDPFADSLTFVTAFACFVTDGYMALWMFWLILLREVSMHFFLRPYFQMRGVVMAAKRAGKFKTVMQSIVSLVLLAFLVFKGEGQPVFPAAVYSQITLAFNGLFLALTVISLGSMVSYLRELFRVTVQEARA